VNHTLDIECLYDESHYRCSKNYKRCYFFYFLFQKLLACIEFGMTVKPKIFKIFSIYLIDFFIFLKKLSSTLYLLENRPRDVS
jgi:hypothetical protein